VAGEDVAFRGGGGAYPPAVEALVVLGLDGELRSFEVEVRGRGRGLTCREVEKGIEEGTHHGVEHKAIVTLMAAGSFGKESVAARNRR